MPFRKKKKMIAFPLFFFVQRSCADVQAFDSLLSFFYLSVLNMTIRNRILDHHFNPGHHPCRRLADSLGPTSYNETKGYFLRSFVRYPLLLSIAF